MRFSTVFIFHSCFTLFLFLPSCEARRWHKAGVCLEQVFGDQSGVKCEKLNLSGASLCWEPISPWQSSGVDVKVRKKKCTDRIAEVLLSRFLTYTTRTPSFPGTALPGVRSPKALLLEIGPFIKVYSSKELRGTQLQGSNP